MVMAPFRRNAFARRPPRKPRFYSALAFDPAQGYHHPMNGPKDKPDAKSDGKKARAGRLAATLRDNLKKRKAQARERKRRDSGDSKDDNVQ